MVRLAYEVNVVNIHFANDVPNWNQGFKRKNDREKNEVPKVLPTELVIELPRDFNERFKKRSDADYLDAIESFVYNNLTKRFQRECTSCQIWIGDDLEVALKRIEDARRQRAIAAAEAMEKSMENDDGDYDEELEEDY